MNKRTDKIARPGGKHPAPRVSRRGAAFARSRGLRLAFRASARALRAWKSRGGPCAPFGKGYDPEMVYVECGRCGAPVIWDSGRATELFEAVGIDPVELDPSCILVTDSCPACGSGVECRARIFHVETDPTNGAPQTHGNA